METDLTTVQMLEQTTQKDIDPNIKEPCELQKNNIAPIELKGDETNGLRPESIIPNDINNLEENVHDVAVSQPNTTIPVPNGIDKDTMKKVSKITTTTKIPVLKITINKEYYKPEPLSPEQYKAIFLSNVVNNVIKKQAIDSNSQNDINIKTEMPTTIAPPIFNLIPMATEHFSKGKHIGIHVKNDICIPKTAYTRKGDLSRDNARNQTSAERLRYLYTKAQRDCDILKIRLKALRERHKHEQEEIKKLQMHARIFCKDIEEESLSDERLSKETICYSLEDREDEEEYQRLLREVREIKKEIIKKKYPVIKPIKRFKGIAKRGRKKMIKVNYSSKGNSVQNGEVVGESYNNSNSVKTNGQSSSDFLSINNESMCFEEEYLDPNLIG